LAANAAPVPQLFTSQSLSEQLGLHHRTAIVKEIKIPGPGFLIQISLLPVF